MKDTKKHIRHAHADASEDDHVGQQADGGKRQGQTQEPVDRHACERRPRTETDGDAGREEGGIDMQLRAPRALEAVFITRTIALLQKGRRQ